MDAGTQGRGLNASMGGRDLKAVRHLICREREFGYPSWRLVAVFITLIPTTKHDLHFRPQHKIEGIFLRGHVARKLAQAGFDRYEAQVRPPPFHAGIFF
jgi:hypothetical protein